MRIISQNGVIDIPYECAALYVRTTEDGFYDVEARLDGTTYVLARYSDLTSAKANMLRAHTCRDHIYVFPDDEEVVEQP